MKNLFTHILRCTGVILGVTGNGHQAEIDLFLSSGADRILIKPLSADQFYEILLGKLLDCDSTVI